MDEFKNPDNLDDILGQARQMDEGAMGQLVKHYYPTVLRFLSYRARNREDAEDLTSEVFVRMVGSIKNQTGNFPAWLFKIARNLLIDYYRKMDRQKSSSLDEIEDDSITVSTEDHREGFMAGEIKHMLTVLTESQAEVISLRFLNGHTLEETAQIMHNSVGAVKILQFRAVAGLKQYLKKDIGA
ncbi:MAG: sigma-70 family RNA polymerase sigma factor [Candidatus Omnitrophica bacterium]|nr:sigma-70 family RNA polymerase sigma factor [Candidatus Omnitrophota bacterium]